MEAEVTCTHSVNSVWSACSEPGAASRGACSSPMESMWPHSQRAAGQAGAANRPRLGQAGGSEWAAGQGPTRDGDTARGDGKLAEVAGHGSGSRVRGRPMGGFQRPLDLMVGAVPSDSAASSVPAQTSTCTGSLTRGRPLGQGGGPAGPQETAAASQPKSRGSSRQASVQRRRGSGGHSAFAPSPTPTGESPCARTQASLVGAWGRGLGGTGGSADEQEGRS